MNYAIIDGTTVKSTGTIQQLFPNTSFSINGPNTDFLTANNVVELVENLSYTVSTQKIFAVDPYLENGKVYTVKVKSMTTEEETIIKNTQWQNVRQERDMLLKETDWRASTDLTLSDDWKSYRQALRDVPTQSDPFNITWPSSPS